MSTHTEGRLTASEILDDGRYGILSAENEIIVGVSSKLTEANARRLVACWNACVGVETGIIESFNGGAAFRVTVAEAAVFEKLRAAHANAVSLLIEVYGVEERMIRGELLKWSEVSDRHERVREFLKLPVTDSQGPR